MKITKEKASCFLKKFHLLFLGLLILFLLLRILFHISFDSLNCFREETLFYCPDNHGEMSLNFATNLFYNLSGLTLDILGILSIVNLILLTKDLKDTNIKNIFKNKYFYGIIFYLIIFVYFITNIWSCYWSVLNYPGYCLVPF